MVQLIHTEGSIPPGLASRYNLAHVSHGGAQPGVRRIRIEARMPGHRIAKTGNLGRCVKNPDSRVVEHSRNEPARDSSCQFRSRDTADCSLMIGDMDSDLPFVPHRGQGPVRNYTTRIGAGVASQRSRRKEMIVETTSD